MSEFDSIDMTKVDIKNMSSTWAVPLFDRDPIIVGTIVSREQMKILAELGFIARYGERGELSFTERDTFAEHVAAGKSRPGSAVQ